MNRVSKGLSVAAALLPLIAAPAALAAVDPPLPSPATVLFHTPIAGTENTTLQGSLCQQPNTCVNVPYVPFVQFPFFPIFSTGTNVATIESFVNGTPGQKILYGYSGAAQTVTEWLRENADDPEAPSPDDLTVVLLANPSRKYGGINAPDSVTPDTQYRVVDVTRQYDYNSDYPTDRFNFLAAANIAAGFFTVHLDYSNVDIDDPNNIVWTEGNTTYVFVPTKNIPLLEGLRMIGLTDLADQWNEPLKAMIEQAYDRSYLPDAESESMTEDAPAIAASMSSPTSVATTTPVTTTSKVSELKVSGSPKAIAPLSPAPIEAAAESGPAPAGVENTDGSSQELAETKTDTAADTATESESEAADKVDTVTVRHPDAQKQDDATAAESGPTADGYVGKHRKVVEEQGTTTTAGDDGPATGAEPSKGTDKDKDTDADKGKTSTKDE